MDSNKLMLNTSKTEVISVGSTKRLSLVDSDSSCIGTHDISHRPSVKYLGVKIDQSPTMRDQVSNMPCLFSVRHIASIRPYLTECVRKTCVLPFAITLGLLQFCSSFMPFAESSKQCCPACSRLQKEASRNTTLTGASLVSCEVS